MSFTSIRQFVESDDGGKTQISSFRKTLPQTTAPGVWFDLSMATGNPVTNFYGSNPLEAATLNGRNGIYHGENVSPQTKHLAKTLVRNVTANAAPTQLSLLDYLVYYPFVDMDSTDEQFLVNDVTLPRYTSGQGVKAFLVAQGNYVGGANFSINYTNQNGTSGRVSQTVTSNSATFTASIVSSGVAAGNVGPFIPLQSGDTGIRSVQSITFTSANGGIAALVLCYPIAQTHIRTVDAPMEKVYSIDAVSYPRIFDGAYLNFIGLATTGSVAAAPYDGIAEFIWG